MKDVQALSEDRVKLSTGTLYGALKRLLEQGWVKRVDDPAPNTTHRQRKAYALVDRGRRLLAAEVARLNKLVAAALAVPGDYFFPEPESEPTPCPEADPSALGALTASEMREASVAGRPTRPPRPNSSPTRRRRRRSCTRTPARSLS